MYGTIEKNSSQATPDQQQHQEPAPQAAANSSKGNNKKRIYSHCHIQSGENERPGAAHVDSSARRRLIVASVVCLLFMLGEIVGGVMSNSLAIATDAAHLLTDFASFLISLFAIWLSTRPVSRQMSFGWYRAEVIGALMSVLMIWLVTGLLVYMAIERLTTNHIDIKPGIMLITASAGLVANIFMALALHAGPGHTHSHSHAAHSHSQPHGCQSEARSHLQLQPQEEARAGPAKLLLEPQPGLVGERAVEKLECQHRGSGNINVRAAFIHVLGDFIQSLGVLVAAAVIYFYPEYAIVDPICTFLFSIIVLITTLTVLRDAINVLMEGIPNGINFYEVRARLSNQVGVLKVHNLRIWSLSLDKIALSTHIVIDTKKVKQSQALNSAIEMLKSSYGFFEITIQIEEYDDDMRDCSHCIDEELLVSLAQDPDHGPTPDKSDHQKIDAKLDLESG